MTTTITNNMTNSLALDPAEALIRLRKRLVAVIGLAGLVRPTQLRAAIGRSVLDLPLDADRTLMDLWFDEVRALLTQLNRESLPVCLAVNRKAPIPTLGPTAEGMRIQVEVDPFEYRGTAGILRDLCAGYGDDDLVLVIHGSQILTRPLAEIAMGLSALNADAAVTAGGSGSPGGTMLIRCGVLHEASPIGYADLKEQLLPTISHRMKVSVLEYAGPVALPVRSLSDYVSALRYHHRRVRGERRDDDPFAESWDASFSVTESGSDVASDARVHDSVVLRGGKVESGAVLVGSVVCAGGLVRRGQMVVDQVVGGMGHKRMGGRQ